VVLQALRAYFGDSEKGWNWIRWQGVRRNNPDFIDGLDNNIRFRWTRRVPDYLLPLPTEWLTFEQALTRRVRKKIRSCYRLLEKDGHVLDFRMISDLSEMNAAVDKFYELHTARAHVRHFDVFADPRAQAFFREYALNSATRGEIKIFQIA